LSGLIASEPDIRVYHLLSWHSPDCGLNVLGLTSNLKMANG
jgi:hypothetical protein